MALNSLTASITVGVAWDAQKSITGTAYQPTRNNTTITKRVIIGTGAANAVAGGGDEVASFITSIAGGGTASLDLTSLTEITGASGISFARVKTILLRLLSTTDDATNGTACTSVTVGNSGANDFIQQGHSGWLGSATSTLDIPNGGFHAFGTPSAGGVVVDATHKIMKVTNNDGAVAAKFESTFFGGSS